MAYSAFERDFSGKVILVTGAGRGLGRALVLAFARCGGLVAANDLTPVNLDETLALARAGAEWNATVRDYLVDISQKMAVQGMLNNLLDTWGRIDVVINNAAVAPRMALLDMDEWDWRRTLDVNLTGSFFLTQVCGRVMREQGGGTILHVLDASGTKSYAPRASYLASKAGAAELVRQAAQELGSYGIRVLGLSPGLLDSESTREWMPADKLAELHDAGELTSLEDAANAALWLAGTGSEERSGQIWRVGPQGVMTHERMDT